MHVAVDAMGGDHAPQVVVEGAVQAAQEYGIPVLLVGDQEVIQQEIARVGGSHLSLVSIKHAPQTVAMDESPVAALRQKQDSSIRVAFQQVEEGEAGAVVSAGNSGAVVATSLTVLGRLPGVDRAAIITPIPTVRGETCLLDAGANTECKPLHLVQFAVMGEVYARLVRGTASPQVGLLSNGQEKSKGIEVTRMAHEVLEKLPLHYVGYVEGRDLNTGTVDVVVTDGFTGNVALKTMEGFAGFFLECLGTLFASSLRGKLAYLLMRKSLAGMRTRFDYAEYGGALLLGINGITIIAHGASTPKAIKNAIRVANEALRHEVNQRIVEEIKGISEMAGLSIDLKRGRGLWRQLKERFKGPHEDHEAPAGEEKKE
jgi:glycerol-3-phosphate acyltransferase PlsX